MALSPADFYAYSRATGVPVPEDPQERAEMAPEVLEFRRNQLKGPQESPNALATLGTAALGLGAAIGAGLAARRFMRGRGQIPQGPPRAANAGVVQQDLSTLRRAAEATRPASEPVAPSRPAPGTTENALLVDPTDRLLEELGQMQASRKQALESRMSRAYGQRLQKTADELLAQLASEGPDLTDIQQATRPAQTQQFIAAVESGEDQASGRIKQRLQQNEDLDMSQVELLEEMAERGRVEAMEQDEPITLAASQLNDGIPVDQTEVAAGAFVQKQMMQTRMNQLRSELSQQGYRGLALEKELASRTNIKQASELYASTGDPSVLSLAGSAPSLPLAVTPKTNLQLGQSKTSIIGEEVPTSAFYEPFKERNVESGGLVSADIHYTNKISNISAKLEGTPSLIDNPEYVNFIDQTNMAMSAMRQGDNNAAKIFNRNKALLDAGKAPTPKLENPEHTMLQNQLAYAEQARANVRAKQESLELQGQRFPTVQKVVSTGEGGRLFGEVDPATGELIPESLEVRSGRFSLPGGTVAATATGRAIRGRVGAEGTVAGPTPGIFEPSAVVTEATFKPETARYRGETGRGTYEAADAGKGLQYEAQPVRWDPNIHAPEQRTPEGFVYSEEALIKPSQPLGVERNLGAKKSPMSVAKPSVELSEEMRTSRDPQALLRSKMAELGVSAIGEFSPYPRRSSTPAAGKQATPAQRSLSRYVRFVGNPYLLD